MKQIKNSLSCSTNKSTKRKQHKPSNQLSELFITDEACEIETSIGIIFLDSLRIGHIIDYQRIIALHNTPLTSFRKLLPEIALLSNISKNQDEKNPLTPDLEKKLSDDDIEKIAVAYISLLESELNEGEKKEEIPFRYKDEPATTYIDRLLKSHINRMESSIDGIYSSSGLFDQVRKSSSEITKTLSYFDSLSSKAAVIDDEHLKNTRITNLLNGHNEKKAAERAEELEMIRLTGKMTAESATILRDLALAASTLLVRFDERAIKSDADTKKQLKVAVWTLIITAVISLIALIFAILSFYRN